MTKTLTLGLCAALLGTAMAGTALAEMGRAEGRMGLMEDFDFAAIDADGDGKITKTEMQAHRTARVAMLDADSDGKISEAELVAQGLQDAEARAVARAKRMIERLDSDGDGSLSAAEILTRGGDAGRLFERVDADDDGGVTQDEITAAQEKFRGRWGEGRKRHHGRRWGGADRG